MAIVRRHHEEYHAEAEDQARRDEALQDDREREAQALARQPHATS